MNRKKTMREICCPLCSQPTGFDEELLVAGEVIKSCNRICSKNELVDIRDCLGEDEIFHKVTMIKCTHCGGDIAILIEAYRGKLSPIPEERSKIWCWDITVSGSLRYVLLVHELDYIHGMDMKGEPAKQVCDEWRRIKDEGRLLEFVEAMEFKAALKRKREEK